MRVLLLIVCLSALMGCSIILPSTPHATTPERSCAPLHPTRFQMQSGEDAGGSHEATLSLSPQSFDVAKVMDAVPLWRG